MPTTSGARFAITHCTISSASVGVASRSIAGISRPVMPFASRIAPTIACCAFAYGIPETRAVPVGFQKISA